MKILLATPYGAAIGGIARWSQHIVEYYKKTGHKDCEMDILPICRQRFFSSLNSVIMRAYNGIRGYYGFLVKEKEMLEAKNYDVFHIVSSASLSLFKDLVMLRAAKKRGVKTVVHFRFGRIPELSLKKNWEWKLLCKVITLSDTTIVLDKTSYNTLHNAGFNNVVLLPNPVAPRVTELIERAGNVERKERTLLFAGHVIPTKGVYELVEACKQIPNIKLRLIGNIADNIRQDLQNNTGNAPWLDIADECAYEKTITEMLSCDIFVLPTYTEGFPNVILESMACGCAIVTTPVGAIPEMLEEEDGKRYGILVEPKKAHELKEGIEAMLNDETLKAECRKNVQQRVNERYNIDAVWSQMLTIWRETAQKTYSK